MLKSGDLVGHLAANRSARLALIQDVLKGKARLADPSGGAGSKPVAVRELSLISSGLDDAGSIRHALQAMPLPRTLLATAWQEATARSEPEQPLDLAEFCRLLRAEPDLADRASAWLSLMGPQDLFRLRKDEIIPRSAAELRLMRRERRLKQLREQRHRHVLEQLAQRQSLDWGQDEPLIQHLRQQLERLAVADDPKAIALDEDINGALNTAGYDGSATSLQSLLMDLGLLQQGQPLSLLGSAWQHGFPADCLQQVKELLTSELTAPGDESRQDLSALPCFAIDSADTREVDDAIGIERRSEGDRIWVHIADPHRLIAPGSPLDQEARRRGSTLYLSSGLQPMLPLELAAGPLSLLPGRRQAAISVAIGLDQDGAISLVQSCRSWIKVSYRLSYEDADELIELAPPEDPDLADLHGLMQQRRLWRQAQGGLLMDQAEGRLFRKGETAELQLEVSEPSPARLLVAEAMVLAGAAMAQWCSEHDLAMPFRGQPGAEPERMEAALRFEDGPVRWAHQRGALSRSRTSCVAEPHQSLGLQAYLQWTSPIRRYGDLLAHRQWLAQMGLLHPSSPPLSAEQLTPLLERSDQLNREASLIARQDQRQALLQWLFESQQGEGPFQSLLLRWLREDLQLALVRVDAWAMDLPARIEGNAEPGQALQLVVTDVNPAEDLLRLTATPC